MLLFTLSLYADKFTFYDIQNAYATKKHVTIVADTTFANEFIVYSDTIDDLLSQDVLLQLVKAYGYTIKRDGKILYIFDRTGIAKQISEYQDKITLQKLKSQTDSSIKKEQALEKIKTKALIDKFQNKHEIDMLEHNSELERKKIITQSNIDTLKLKQDMKKKEVEQRFELRLQKIKSNKIKKFYTELDTDRVQKLCKSLDLECVYKSNGYYLINYSPVNSERIDLLTTSNENSYILNLEIVEIEKSKILHNSINLNTFINAITSTSLFSISVLGNISDHYDNANAKIDARIALDILKDNGIAKTISRPTVRLVDGIKNVFETGQTVQVVSSVHNDKSTKTVSYDYKTVDIGLLLTTTPQIRKNFVYLDFDLSMTSLLSYDKDKNLAQTSKRHIQNFYRLNYGQTVYIAGYEHQFDKKKVYKDGAGSKLPFFGSLFGGTNTDKTDSILIIKLNIDRV